MTPTIGATASARTRVRNTLSDSRRGPSVTASRANHEALFAFLLTARGLVSIGVWCRAQFAWTAFTMSKKKMREKLKDVGTGAEDINWALRKEILYYTTTGIVEGVNLAQDTYQHAEGKVSEYGKSFVSIPLKQRKDDDEDSWTRTKSVGAASGGKEPLTDSNGKPAAKESPVVFTDYFPETFRRVRARFGVTSDMYRASMSATAKERFSEGKSAAFLYFTGDRKYVIKTCTKEEAVFFIPIVHQYSSYVLENRNTLITRFFGLHSITLYGRQVFFVVMSSVFPNPDIVIHKRYDLKGSWIKRLDKENTPKSVGKDLNISQPLNLQAGVARKLAVQLAMDAQFLADMNIMDYSLLLGVHNSSFDVSKTKAFRRSMAVTSSAGGAGGAGLLSGGAGALSALGGAGGKPGEGSDEPLATDDELAAQVENGFFVTNVVGPSAYFMGIIDILQDYNARKHAETWYKTTVAGSDPEGLSCVHPKKYAIRFIHRVVQRLVSPHTHFDSGGNLARKKSKPSGGGGGLRDDSMMEEDDDEWEDEEDAEEDDLQVGARTSSRLARPSQFEGAEPPMDELVNPLSKAGSTKAGAMASVGGSMRLNSGSGSGSALAAEGSMRGLNKGGAQALKHKRGKSGGAKSPSGTEMTAQPDQEDVLDSAAI